MHLRTFTSEALVSQRQISSRFSLGPMRHKRTLHPIGASKPGMIVADQDTEFASNTMLACSQTHQIMWHCIARGKLMQSGFCESFNGRMREKLLTRTCPSNLDHARATIASWIADYNEQRPHSQPGYLIRARYAANLTAICDRLRNPDQLRRSHVAPHAPHRVKPIETLIAAG
jgi:putative transposase